MWKRAVRMMLVSSLRLTRSTREVKKCSVLVNALALQSNLSGEQAAQFKSTMTNKERILLTTAQTQDFQMTKPGRSCQFSRSSRETTSVLEYALRATSTSLLMWISKLIVKFSGPPPFDCKDQIAKLVTDYGSSFIACFLVIGVTGAISFALSFAICYIRPKHLMGIKKGRGESSFARIDWNPLSLINITASF